MVDRRERTEREQRDRKRHEVGRHPRPDERDAAAEIEHRHHVAPAPAVGEPARRQREHTEGDERRRAERDQLAVALGVHELERDHHGREDQDHVVVDRVTEVEKADRQAALIVNASVGQACHCGSRIGLGKRSCRLRFGALPPDPLVDRRQLARGEVGVAQDGLLRALGRRA